MVLSSFDPEDPKDKKYKHDLLLKQIITEIDPDRFNLKILNEVFNQQNLTKNLVRVQDLKKKQKSDDLVALPRLVEYFSKTESLDKKGNQDTHVDLQVEVYDRKHSKKNSDLYTDLTKKRFQEALKNIHVSKLIAVNLDQKTLLRIAYDDRSTTSRDSQIDFLHQDVLKLMSSRTKSNPLFVYSIPDDDWILM
jgi:hypothetical protein